MKLMTTKMAFFIDKERTRLSDGTYIPRAVTGVFVDTGDYRMKECYAHVGQHGTCAVDWVAENCRPATYAEFKELYDELENMVGYEVEVVDAEWWLAKAMDSINNMAA